MNKNKKKTNKNERNKVISLHQTLEIFWAFDLTIPFSQSNKDKTRRLVNSETWRLRPKCPNQVKL